MALSTMSLEDQLKRIIYVNRDQLEFYAGDPDTYQRRRPIPLMQAITVALQNNLNPLFTVIDSANSDKNLPRRSMLFFLLAKLMYHEKMTPNLKNKITTKVLEICQTDQDFFDFVKYYTEIRRKCKLPSSMEKAVRKFYLKKSPLDLAHSFAKFNSYHKWSHKDLIKLAHVKSDTPIKNIVINYILTKKVNNNESDEEKKVLNVLEKSDELRSAQDSITAIPLISELKSSIKQVSPDLHQSGEVWAAVLKNMSIQEILPCLGKLYKLGLLKQSTPISAYLVDLFSSPKIVKDSGVHPVEVLIYAKRLEKGGKPADPRLLRHLQEKKNLSLEDLKSVKKRTEAKCPHILKALEKCFDVACSNLPSANKRYLVTIDVTEKAKNTLCIANKVLTIIEAAVAFALVLIRVEKDVVVATYTENKINILNIEKKITFAQLLEKVKSQTSAYSPVMAPIDWAASEKKHVDVFVNFLHHECMQTAPQELKESLEKTCKNLEPLAKYRKKVNLPNAKLISFCLSSRNFTYSHHDVENHPQNALQIVGFDSAACKVAEAFCRGSFC